MIKKYEEVVLAEEKRVRYLINNYIRALSIEDILSALEDFIPFICPDCFGTWDHLTYPEMQKKEKG